jgi:hypothetical protein
VLQLWHYLWRHDSLPWQVGGIQKGVGLDSDGLVPTSIDNTRHGSGDTGTLPKMRAITVTSAAETALVITWMCTLRTFNVTHRTWSLSTSYFLITVATNNIATLSTTSTEANSEHLQYAPIYS